LDFAGKKTPRGGGKKKNVKAQIPKAPQPPRVFPPPPLGEADDKCIKVLNCNMNIPVCAI